VHSAVEKLKFTPKSRRRDFKLWIDLKITDQVENRGDAGFIKDSFESGIKYSSPVRDRILVEDLPF
jgi:hypothetical protein